MLSSRLDLAVVVYFLTYMRTVVPAMSCARKSRQVDCGPSIGWPPLRADSSTSRGDSEKCINQDHSCKPDEIVENTACKIARKWFTNLMELFDVASKIDPDINNRLQLREDGCSKSNPCDCCQGDCDADVECRGADLMCFQRGGRTKDAPVPGCNKGVAEPGMGDVCCVMCRCVFG